MFVKSSNISNNLFEMDSTLNRPLSKKIVGDSRFYYCIRITYQGEHYGHVWFWEGSTPLGVAATQSFVIFQKMLEMYHFGRVQYLVRYIFRGTFDPTGSLWGLKPPTIILYKTTLNLDTFRVFAKKKFI
jgi:hypothetical protein